MLSILSANFQLFWDANDIMEIGKGCTIQLNGDDNSKQAEGVIGPIIPFGRAKGPTSPMVNSSSTIVISSGAAIKRPRLDQPLA